MDSLYVRLMTSHLVGMFLLHICVTCVIENTSGVCISYGEVLSWIWVCVHLFPDEELDLESDGSAEQPNISETKFVDYDSEENEVVDSLEPQEIGVSEFFEDEAELSESDWDSADEDEQDLDTLEFEEGDAEKLDQHKVKEQLDKIYM